MKLLRALDFQISKIVNKANQNNIGISLNIKNIEVGHAGVEVLVSRVWIL
jgi:hypothetical protein